MAEKGKRTGRPRGQSKTMGQAQAERDVIKGVGDNNPTTPARLRPQSSDADDLQKAGRAQAVEQEGEYNKNYAHHSTAINDYRKAISSGKGHHVEAAKQVFWTKMHGPATESQNDRYNIPQNDGTSALIKAILSTPNVNKLHASLPVPCSTAGCAGEASGGSKGDTCPSCTK